MYESMTTAEKLSLGVETTGLGLLVTFVALVFLIVIIYIFSAAIRGRDKLREEATPAVPAWPVAPGPAVRQETDDGELIAALTAAAAYMMADGGANTTGLAVRSYRKVNGASAWGKAGRNAQIYNKF
jgi:sodium pump decarboxylase gamma subunit